MNTPRKTAPPLWHVHAAGLLAVLGVSGLALALFVKPRLSAREFAQSQREEIQSLENAASDAENSAVRIEGEASRLEGLAQRRAIPLTPISGLLGRLDAFSSLAQSSGVKILELKPGAEKAVVGYPVTPVKLRATATYERCTNLLRTLPTKFPDVAVEGLHLRGDANVAEAPATLELDMEWFSAPDAPAGTVKK
jgi:hypothetical protein